MLLSAYDAQDIAGTLSNFGSLARGASRPKPLKASPEASTVTPLAGRARLVPEYEQIAKKERALERLYAASPFSW